jgi:hypothetical protein
VSWDLSSEDVIVNKLEAQHATILLFSKKIKDLQARISEADELLKVMPHSSLCNLSMGINMPCDCIVKITRNYLAKYPSEVKDG